MQAYAGASAGDADVKEMVGRGGSRRLKIAKLWMTELELLASQ